MLLLLEVGIGVAAGVDEGMAVVGVAALATADGRGAAPAGVLASRLSV
jgi:hypothetical protein